VFSIVDVRAYHVGQQEAYSDQVTVTVDELAVNVQPGGSHPATAASRSNGPGEYRITDPSSETAGVPGGTGAVVGD
jgi:hypothetical protein